MHRRSVAALLVLLWVTAGLLWLVRPAGASSSATRSATLAVTGVVVDNCPVSVGGSVLYVKPGDTVDFRSTLAGINVGSIQYNGLPLGLSTSNIADLNSNLVFADERTAAGKPVNHALKSSSYYARTFPKQGTYTFGWTAQSLTLLHALNLPLIGQLLTVPLGANTPLASAQATLSWGGKVIVSDKATQCGLSAQLPGVSVSASATVVGKLPPITIPGATLPSIPLPTQLPTVKLSGPGTSAGDTRSTPATRTTTQGQRVDYTPHGPGVAATTVPTGYGNGSGQTGAAGGGVGPEITASSGQGSAALAGAGYTPSPSGNAVDLARPDARSNASDRMNLIWVIAAVAALSTAVVAYARQFLAGGRAS